MPDAEINDIDNLRRELNRLRAENARLARLLDLRGDAMPPPEQPAAALAPPGPVTIGSSSADKLALYRSLFRARADVYAVRWENPRAGTAGWVPAVAGGWRKGMDRSSATHLPLTDQVRGDDLVGERKVRGRGAVHPLAPATGNGGHPACCSGPRVLPAHRVDVGSGAEQTPVQRELVRRGRPDGDRPGRGECRGGLLGRGHGVPAKVEQARQASVLCAQPVQLTAKVVDVVDLGIGHDRIVAWTTSRVRASLTGCRMPSWRRSVRWSIRSWREPPIHDPQRGLG